ncbi:MAG: cytoplasmic protein [bacterium]
MVGFGLDREHDENTVIYYLQKFSDDTVMKTLIKRLTDEDLEELFDLVNRMLKKHFSETEYHGLFLKETDHPH